ncbi:hypothetical protein SSP24_61650 [Streptomyces spinoverrucosus]|jgi:hypothetical protein|uniref:DUF2304 domain-containing protein n=1 Tax=Streptomyces spinoverrucosus TaxID=284043 RepID=A0A4Y3VS75_9ACTN|nr:MULTISPECIES: hypothetical protein [Streptomyces]ATW50575.1 hypothetical protein CGZ69_24560 [Streptomyces peucetius subsp. caesius ATCC 27952]THC53703.1 hypothetical protein E7X38_20750 [Streptomyces sp. Akac8]MYX09810.1 hypothetical protein [Streptomyces sp. SID8375]GEC08510.1 hypothetical protein SSP24_61650 [Streptomyces spinoverrucosus]GHB91797.1 hypothetical protein GCM10010397_75340 [Streptomyces spinoverrucosus]
MAVTISLALLFGFVLFMLLRSKTLGPGSAFVAVMFGFYLASTGAADTVNQLMSAIVNALPDL